MLQPSFRADTDDVPGGVHELTWLRWEGVPAVLVGVRIGTPRWWDHRQSVYALYTQPEFGPYSRRHVLCLVFS